MKLLSLMMTLLFLVSCGGDQTEVKEHSEDESLIPITKPIVRYEPPAIRRDQIPPQTTLNTYNPSLNHEPQQPQQPQVNCDAYIAHGTDESKEEVYGRINGIYEQANCFVRNIYQALGFRRDIVQRFTMVNYLICDQTFCDVYDREGTLLGSIRKN